MAWNEQWSIKVDGNELNDHAAYWTMIPEWDNAPDDDVVLVEIDGSSPSYIRNQPKEGVYTLLIACPGSTWSTWNTRLTALRSVLTKGVHTLTVQIRGMPTAASVTIVVRGSMVMPKERRLVVNCIVPQPYAT